MRSRKLAGWLLASLSVVFVVSCRQGSEAPAPSKPAPAAAAKAPTWEEHLAEWKQKRDARLRAEDGWLTLVGLHWLEEGANRFGSDPKNEIVLPAIGEVPPFAGTIIVEKGEAYLQSEKKDGVVVGGKASDRIKLVTDAEGKPNTIRFGPVSFYVIRRGEKLGVRVKNSESEARKNFKGMEYFPSDAKWRVEARLEPHDPPKKIPITNIVGMTADEVSPGSLVFTVDGAEHRLDPILEEGSSELFVIFGDATNGKETYEAGRYLYTALPGPDGKVILDFNMAYNPPCVFSPHATCPLPPAQNKLKIPIAAGEKKYVEHAAGEAATPSPAAK